MRPNFAAPLCGLMLSCGPQAQSGPDSQRAVGQTEFVSANTFAGPVDDRTGGVDYGAPQGEDDTGERTVEEGDIFRLLSGGRLVNLNAYRGLQVLDLADPDHPAVLGRLQISGWPVEMYVVGDTVLVLMNEWYGYFGDVASAALVSHDGGVVLSVDITDPTAPRLLDRAVVPGAIQTSRLSRLDAAAALYVVSGGWWDWQGDGSYSERTLVRSFALAGGLLVPASELDLGGFVAAVQATPSALLVARTDWASSEGTSVVSILDIQDPAGTMVPGGEAAVAGRVLSQFNLDLRGDVLRVVSGSTWGAARVNHLQTFAAAGPGALPEIDHEVFGEDEDLFATVLLEDAAFCVTYQRVDPFHAFSIDAAGDITAAAEFTVSGWNDFLSPIFADSRLLGIGSDDQAGTTVSVSLYDITDLANPTPLVARADVAAAQSWSEASWDHRAFTVLEDAVDVVAPGGAHETGLLLLPFTGWRGDAGSYEAAVQLFTFSPTSLTRRGLMEHGTPVRRSFAAPAGSTGNLSDAELSLFDCTDPDACAERGRLELAPSYTAVLAFGDHVARLHSALEDYVGWWGDAVELPPSTVEVVPAASDPDLAAAVASFAVPADATLYRTGDLLVALTSRVLDATQWPYTYESTLEVWDMTDAAAPRRAGSLVTTRLQPGWSFAPAYADCATCGAPLRWGWGYGGVQAEAVPGGLVFWQTTQERERVGLETVCVTTPAGGATCAGDPAGPSCVQYSGSIECHSLYGAEPYCSGEIVACDGGSAWSCAVVDPGGIDTDSSCWQWERYRYWQQVSLEVLDLRQAEAPRLAETVVLPRDEAGLGLVVEGSSVWIALDEPRTLAGDSRAYVAYGARRLDVHDPASPVLGGKINVPGQLLAVEGNTLFTRDQLWADSSVVTGVARSVVLDGHASLQAWRDFPDRMVEAVRLDGDGQVLVSHGPSWHDLPVVGGVGSSVGTVDGAPPPHHLTVLDAASPTLAVMADVAVAPWATLRDARAGRALFQVPGGLLVYSLEQPTAPQPQAFFALRGWPAAIHIERGQVMFAAGRYGIYRFDLDTFNLPAPPAASSFAEARP